MQWLGAPGTRVPMSTGGSRSTTPPCGGWCVRPGLRLSRLRGATSRRNRGTGFPVRGRSRRQPKREGSADDVAVGRQHLPLQAPGARAQSRTARRSACRPAPSRPPAPPASRRPLPTRRTLESFFSMRLLKRSTSSRGGVGQRARWRQETDSIRREWAAAGPARRAGLPTRRGARRGRGSAPVVEDEMRLVLVVLRPCPSACAPG